MVHLRPYAASVHIHGYGGDVTKALEARSPLRSDFGAKGRSEPQTGCRFQVSHGCLAAGCLNISLDRCRCKEIWGSSIAKAHISSILGHIVNGVSSLTISLIWFCFGEAL
ncbi:hypothetical protein U1Q18_014480 [Sarracenia purpurea var. burkii]